MALAIGTRVGPYEIVATLGAGGMGEVYRGRDSRLKRDVAIKVLPTRFTNDPDRAARFDREARLLATLNHPHVAAIYGVEEANGTSALVLELVEGETLAEHLAKPAGSRGPGLPLSDALAIARQIADALAAAHEKGIIHRDLKPANIKITPDGVVKVLDFGLAKVVAGDEPGRDLSHLDTTAAGTRDGAILGTVAYMSPEQARGKAIDKRTDIWAFGCVLHELLTGRMAFAGETMSDTIAAILDREPDWTALPPATPPAVARLLRRCLEKDPKRRLHDIADARIEIDEALEAPAAASVSAPRAATRRGRLQRAAAAAAVVAALSAAAIGGAIYLRRDADILPMSRLSVFTPGILSPQLSAVLSPDGRHLAFVTTGDSGKLMLWVRALDALEARVLRGTESAAHPFWSPDGRFLGFLADGKLKTVEASGGVVETLGDAPIRIGPSWSKDGTILFVLRGGALATISANGGPATTILTADHTGGLNGWPHFLPDGRHFLFHSRGRGPEERGVYLGSLGSTETKLLVQTECKGAYASGHLLFVRGETLMAQPFDLERLELTGQPVRVADGVWVAAGAAQASFSVSQTGVLAYVNAAFVQLAWVDRSGRALGRIGEPDRFLGTPQLSPDGKRIAIAKGVAEGASIWALDASGGSGLRISFAGTRNVDPAWSADGSRIAFRSESRLYVKNASGAGTEELLHEFDRVVTLDDWSSDGRSFVYTALGPRSASDLWRLSLNGDRKPIPFLETSFNKAQAQLSPDGRWIAYTSYESGGDEVYVDSFPTPGNRQQISTAGGVQPRWRQDGAELFFITPDQRVMAVPITRGATFQRRPAIPLFKARTLPHGSQSIGLPTLYDVSPDGRRFLFIGPAEDRPAPITVVQNWPAALRK